jgi:hypothetical protein
VRGEDLGDVQPTQRPMNAVIWTYQEIDPDFRQLVCGEKHQLGHALPIATTNARHVARKRERMHGDFGMSVRAELLRTLNADGPVAKSCAFGRAGSIIVPYAS